tara:strand:+ start:155483 stop:156118 length:636 start_codon:yes stop_codon:yes gene_type:complete
MNFSINFLKVDQNLDDKKQLFIDATICSLANHGYKGTTVRQIAKYAGVAPGLLTHYFIGKEALIAESYKYFANKFLDNFKEEIIKREANPLNALKIYIMSTFEPQTVDSKYLSVWLAFWSLTLKEQELRDAHKEIYGQYIDAIERLLRAAYKQSNMNTKERNLKSLAVGIYALLDGLWLECCLDPEAFSQDAALETVYKFVENATELNLNS